MKNFNKQYILKRLKFFSLHFVNFLKWLFVFCFVCAFSLLSLKKLFLSFFLSLSLSFFLFSFFLSFFLSTKLQPNQFLTKQVPHLYGTSILAEQLSPTTKHQVSWLPFEFLHLLLCKMVGNCASFISYKRVYFIVLSFPLLHLSMILSSIPVRND